MIINKKDYSEKLLYIKNTLMKKRSLNTDDKRFINSIFNLSVDLTQTPFLFALAEENEHKTLDFIFKNCSEEMKKTALFTYDQLNRNLYMVLFQYSNEETIDVICKHLPSIKTIIMSNGENILSLAIRSKLSLPFIKKILSEHSNPEALILQPISDKVNEKYKCNLHLALEYARDDLYQHFLTYHPELKYKTPYYISLIQPALRGKNKTNLDSLLEVPKEKEFFQNNQHILPSLISSAALAGFEYGFITFFEKLDKKNLSHKEFYQELLINSCQGGNLKIVEYLYQNAPSSALDIYTGKYSPVEICLNKKHLDILKFFQTQLDDKSLLRHKKKRSNTELLCRACCPKYIKTEFSASVKEIVDYLYKNIDAPNKNDLFFQQYKDFQTPLHSLIKANDSQLNAWIIEQILSNKVKIKVKDRFQRTILHFAAEARNEDIILDLISKGFELHENNILGQNALNIILQRPCSENVLKALKHHRYLHRPQLVAPKGKTRHSV